MSAIKEKITRLVEPLLASLRLKLWGMEYLPANRSILRVYIEKEDNATENADDALTGQRERAEPEQSGQAGINECAKASHLIGLSLDVEDIILGPYMLEVSTPGLDRLFFRPEQLARYYGEVVELALLYPQASHPGRKKFTGHLGRSDEKNFSLELLTPADLTPEDVPSLHFNWDNVKKIRLVYVAPEKKGTPKPKKPRPKN